MSKRTMGKKATAFLLCGVAVLSMAACGGGVIGQRDSQEEYDPTKTYLNVGNYNGGLGYAWLRDVADKYEAAHPDVRIKINNEKDKYMDATLLEQMPKATGMKSKRNLCVTVQTTTCGKRIISERKPRRFIMVYRMRTVFQVLSLTTIYLRKKAGMIMKA